MSPLAYSPFGTGVWRKESTSVTSRGDYACSFVDGGRKLIPGQVRDKPVLGDQVLETSGDHCRLQSIYHRAQAGRVELRQLGHGKGVDGIYLLPVGELRLDNALHGLHNLGHHWVHCAFPRSANLHA